MKEVIIINGIGGVGKDTLCELAAKHFKVMNISSITPVKEIAKLCGWNGDKSDASRKFLSDLKLLMISYNDYPLQWLKKQYELFLNSDQEILFIHIREPQEIAKCVQMTGGKAKALLVRPGNRLVHHGSYGNTADDDVEKYTYDLYFTNDQPLDVTENSFVALLQTLEN